MIEAEMIARAVENICKSRQKLRINEWHKEVRIRDIRRAETAVLSALPICSAAAADRGLSAGYFRPYGAIRQR